ncbi:MAG: hypothetical protein J7J15_03255 [Candidatus Aenigmarchaeota archaeon]|nr:hypothetical protein [Candidatus Aenigmarchaeota archaeon]
MEMPFKIVFGIIFLLVMLILVISGIMHHGILVGFENILSIGGDWLTKLFS